MNGGQGTIDTAELLIWSLVVFVILVFVIPNIIWPNFYLGLWMSAKGFELKAVYTLFGWLMTDNTASMFAMYIERLETLEATDITWRHATQVERFTLSRYGFIFPAALVVWAIKALSIKPESKGMLDMEKLIDLQTRSDFRFNRHLIKHNPLKDPRLDPTRGIYAQRMQPIEFCKRNKIITLKEDAMDDEDEVYYFHSERAHEVLLDTLSAPFQGPDHLKREERWMLAAFLKFISGDLGGYHDFLGDISTALSHDNAKQTEKELAAVDKKTTDAINRLSIPNPVCLTVKNHLKYEAKGNNTMSVIRDLTSALEKDHGVNSKLRKTLGDILGPEVYETLAGKRYSDDVFEDAILLSTELKMFLYVYINAALGNLDEALALARRYKEINDIEPGKRIDEELHELIEINNTIEVTILVNTEKDPAESYKNAVRSHNFSHGVLLRLYRESSDLGVICTSRFTWLMLFNRRLFLTLNDDGAPEHSIEVTYERIHFNAEIECGRKLKTPEVQHQVQEIKKRLLQKIDLADEELEEVVVA